MRPFLQRFSYLLKQVFSFPVVAAVVLFIWIQNKQWKVRLQGLASPPPPAKPDGASPSTARCACPMKKIGIVSEYFYPHVGGITEHVYFYAKELARRGHEVVILTGHRGNPVDVPLSSSLRVVQLARSMRVFANGSTGKISVGWDLGRRVREILEREKFDLLHLHNPLDPVLPLLFLKYSKTITVGTFHTVLASTHFFKMFQRIAQNYLNKLDGIIAVSPSCAEMMERHFENTFEVIPNGVDAQWFANPPGRIEKYDDGRPTILFLGRLDPRNGLDHLLEAFPRVLKEIPEARLVVAGDGLLRSYYEKKAGSFLGEKIFFEGQVNGTRPEYFAASAVFCYPAAIASFGIALLEAMAAGTPVVATENEGFRALIQNGVNGILVKPADPKALAEGLIRAMRDKALAEELKKNGRRTAEGFSWPRVTDQVLSFYEDVLKKRGASFAA
jgi:phosphatidyl-myo-inositol alpha-mannosyltransferase